MIVLMCNIHEIVVLEVGIFLCVHSYVEFQELSTIGLWIVLEFPHPHFSILFSPPPPPHGQIVTCSSASAGSAPPTDVTAEQTSVSTVLVMWTAPSPPPTGGYQVQITRGSTTITVNVAGTSHTETSLQHDVYNIQVKSLVQHLPSEATEPVEITVRGIYTCVVSIKGSDNYV